MSAKPRRPPAKKRAPRKKPEKRRSPLVQSFSPAERLAALEKLAAEQGVKPIDNPEELLGKGSDLWADDAEFEEFLAWLRESRRTGG